MMTPLKFKTRKALIEHFLKHGPQVNAPTPEDYLESANKVLSEGVRVPAKYGKLRVYNPLTDEHIIVDPKLNKLLTYYIRKSLL